MGMVHRLHLSFVSLKRNSTGGRFEFNHDAQIVNWRVLYIVDATAIHVI
jgi:hypothetical protein